MKFPVRFVTLFLISIGFLLPMVTFGQTEVDPTSRTSQSLGYSTSINQGDIDVILQPEYPSAFQRVSIRLDSNTIDLNRYEITWFEDGAQVQSGIGERNFSTTSGGYGTTKKITISVRLETILLQKQILISPQDATVLWEAIDSYVPAFYRGKKLPGRESLIKISGIPNFKVNNSLKTNDAVYLWERNNNKILGVGGYSKDSIVIEQNRLRESEKITTTISDMFGSSTRRSVTIPTINPEIHWYVRDDYGYRGLWSVDQGLRILKGDTTLIAEPYFFSVRNDPNDLTTIWRTGSGETISLDGNAPKQELLVKNPGQTGQVTFQVSVENPKTFLQTAAKSISLYFQNQ